MELRHLRYFVAVAEAGSLTVAAEQRLHTAQPSLSRQIRDLEHEVGTRLLTRSVRGIELTAAGTAFLEHARLALMQAEAAVTSARRAAGRAKPAFALGFLTGQEMEWLPEAMTVLKNDLPTIDVTVSSDYSPQLALDLARGKIDLAFMRPEPEFPDLIYKVVATEPLVIILPGDHHLAPRTAIAMADLADEIFVGMSQTAPVLRMVIDDYLRRTGAAVRREHEIDNISMAISLVASTRGVSLLPAYVRNFLPRSVISRPLLGETPTIDLVIGYNATNKSLILKRFLSRTGEVIARVEAKALAAK